MSDALTTCCYCGEPCVWRSVRFQSGQRRTLRVLVSVDPDPDGRVIRWHDEWVSIKPTSSIRGGVETFRLHGKIECRAPDWVPPNQVRAVG